MLLEICGISAIFFLCLFMTETQVLMKVSNFLEFFSRNHFLEDGFTFQWGVVFQIEGGFIFKWWEVPHGDISFDGGLKKKCRMGGATPHAPPPPSPLLETL